MSDDKVVRLPNARTPEARQSDNVRIAAYEATLQRIAQGRTDNGRPMASERARQICRETLSDWGVRW